MGRHGFEKVHCYVADTFCLLFVHMERVHHSLDGRLTRIPLQFSSGKVVQDAVAKRTVGDFHHIDFELFKYGDQNGNAARKHLSAVLFQPVELNLVNAFGMDHLVLELLKCVKSDRTVGNFERGQNRRNGTDGTGRAERLLPISLNKFIFAAVQNRSGRQNGALHALSRNFAVFKESHRGVDAAHVKGLTLDHLVASSDHALRRCTSDIHDQSSFIRRRKRKAAALEYKSRFFFASKDFNLTVKNLFCALNELL